jgi:putative spermidine/putrescine transport system substrate-binding protein
MNYQLSRRSFLQGTITIALSQILSSCSNTETISQVLFLENSLPSQLIENFHQAIKQKAKIKFKPEAQISQIFELLANLPQGEKLDLKNKNPLDKIFKKSVIYPSLTTLGDAWLADAINQNLLKPLSVKNLANWQKLHPSWQKLVRRNNQGNLADNGEIYGAPYRWGCTVIAYRSDKLAQLNLVPKDWQDLWNLALRDRISLLDSPREVIGLTLKKLGQSYNEHSLDSVPDLTAELLALHQQAKLYSSDHYLEPLILGDTWAAVAWSTDILPILKRYPEIKFIIPQSGASLWADLWVKPQLSPAISEVSELDNSAIIDEWINYCWESQAAKQISLFTAGISPILATLNPKEIPSDLQDNILLNSTVLNLDKSDKSEFLLPLPPEIERQYRDLWLKVRQSGVKDEE